jgi:hypothetical protein
MSETKQLLRDKKAITPLWIVALFVSLTETVLGVAVTQTSGDIQVSLTVFVIIFPLLIAGSFFGILWSKPYVFYPPTEFGPQINVADYVDAMQRKPALLREYGEAQVVRPPTEKEVRAIDQIVEMFLSNLAPNGLLYLYAFSLAHLKDKTVIWKDLRSVMMLSERDNYGMGILSASSAVGLLSYTRVSVAGTVTWGANIVEMNEKVRKRLRSALDERIVTLEAEGYFDEGLGDAGLGKERLTRWQEKRILRIEEYFESPI